jgi:hypothetical protein
LQGDLLASLGGFDASPGLRSPAVARMPSAVALTAGLAMPL